MSGLWKSLPGAEWWLVQHVSQKYWRQETLEQKKGADLPEQLKPLHKSHDWSSSTYGFTSAFRIKLEKDFI